LKLTLRDNIISLAATMLFGISLQAQQFTTIYSFSNTPDGGALDSGVLLDPAGNIYGTTTIGGANGCGAVYEIDSKGNEQILHSFTECSNTTASPDSSLIRHQSGNLYGTAYGAGPSFLGNVFKIDASGNYQPIYDFLPTHDGRHPYAGLVQDSAGNLYGATRRGGSKNVGIVFKIDAAGVETVLHDFTGGADGAIPFGTPIRDSNGNLYGTTSRGGMGFGFGTIYKIDATGQFTTLHTFAGGAQGGRPLAGLVRDSAGNLYGVTSNLGPSEHNGTLFKLDSAGKLTILHNFDAGGGRWPMGGLVRDSAGNLFGTCFEGGSYNAGTVFMFSATGVFRMLHEFNVFDGENPQGALTMDDSGILYGTTNVGGLGHWGTVFKISKH